eukprot:scaffold126_cov129-Isochrysis_galbana.AAC.1
MDRVPAASRQKKTLHHECFILAGELEALANNVVDGAKNVIELEEKFARPIETEGRTRHRDDVEVPDNFFAGCGDEAVIGVDLALLPVALEHPEADSSARLRECRVVESARALAIALDLEPGVGLRAGGALFVGMYLSVGDLKLDLDAPENEVDVVAMLGFDDYDPSIVEASPSRALSLVPTPLCAGHDARHLSMAANPSQSHHHLSGTVRASCAAKAMTRYPLALQ